MGKFRFLFHAKLDERVIDGIAAFYYRLTNDRLFTVSNIKKMQLHNEADHYEVLSLSCF